MLSKQTMPTISEPKYLLSHEIKLMDPNFDSRFQNVTTLIVKITHRCNLDCHYCYEKITKGKDMAIDTFKLIANKALASSQQNKVRFIFHGGEPTLLSDDWFYTSINYANMIANTYQKEVCFSIQTNLIALNPEKIKLFQDLGINISVSLDGFSSIPEPLRQRSEKAIENYQKMQKLGVFAGVLTTINHSNFNRFSEICTWLEKDLQVHKFKANIASSVGRGIELPELYPEQIFQAYHDILEYMIATNGEKIMEENLSLELIRFFSSQEELANMPIEICRARSCGAGNTVIGITTEGNLLPCGRFEWNDETYFLGELNDSDFLNYELDYNKAVEKFHNLVPESWYDCQSCDAKKVCSFGCQAFIVRSKKQANIDCKPTKMRFAYYQKNALRLEPIVDRLRTRFLSNKEASHYSDGDYGDASYGDYGDAGPGPNL